MYTDQLDKVLLNFDQIYLDPNNPRFWTEKGTRIVPDKKISDEKIQAKAFMDISIFGVQELRDSILRNGFLPLDRIVVRPIAGYPKKFVIVEGNRRFAALKTLRQEIEEGTVNEEGISEDYLEKLLSDTNKIDVLNYQGSETQDISWLLQGIRHISGICDWSPAQRARLVAEQIDEKDIGFKAAGQTFGLSAQSVGRLYRAYKALDQMREDDEFSSKAKNEYFTLFEEAIKNKTVREWLDWSNDTWKFENEDNLKQFYAWISPDEDHNDKRRIHDPRQIRNFGILIAGNYKTFLTQIDQYELTFEEAYGKTLGMQVPYDWKEKIDQARKIIADLPQEPMFKETKAFLTALEGIEEQIKQRKAAISGLTKSSK